MNITLLHPHTPFYKTNAAILSPTFNMEMDSYIVDCPQDYFLMRRCSFYCPTPPCVCFKQKQKPVGLQSRLPIMIQENRTKKDQPLVQWLSSQWHSNRRCKTILFLVLLRWQAWSELPEDYAQVKTLASTPHFPPSAMLPSVTSKAFSSSYGQANANRCHGSRKQ